MISRLHNVSIIIYQLSVFKSLTLFPALDISYSLGAKNDGLYCKDIQILKRNIKKSFPGPNTTKENQKFICLFSPKLKHLALLFLGVKWLSIQCDGVLKAVFCEKSLHNVRSAFNPDAQNQAEARLRPQMLKLDCLNLKLVKHFCHSVSLSVK